MLSDKVKEEEKLVEREFPSGETSLHRDPSDRGTEHSVFKSVEEHGNKILEAAIGEECTVSVGISR
jgi:hypothetical protein